MAFFSPRSSVSTWYTQFPLTSLVVGSKIKLQKLPSFLPHLLVDLQNTCSLRWVSLLIYNDFFAVVWGSYLHIPKPEENSLQNRMPCLELFHLPACFHLKLFLSYFFWASFCFILVCSVGSNAFALVNHQVCFCWEFGLVTQVWRRRKRLNFKAQLSTRRFFPKCSLALSQSPPELLC